MTAYEIITDKRDGKELSKDQINFMVNGFTDETIPAYQVSSLLMAIFLNGMTTDEMHFLTQAMLHSGEVVNLSKVAGIKVDKHSTGGVGDKVSIILAPIVAAAGVPVPMISGRGLGHTGGTLDKLQSIPGFRIDYNTSEYEEIINEVGVCLIGQTETIAPADKKLYALRDVTATVQSIPLICGSIMSKKLAEGIDALVLDVKTGHGAFMQDYDKSVELAKNLIGIGEKGGKQTVAFITNMDQPLGFTVGNWLEIKECIDCLKGNGPDDLMELTHNLCGAMIWLGGNANSLEEGIAVSQQMIQSGKAWDKFLEIVGRQEGCIETVNQPENYPKAKYTRSINAQSSGFVSEVNSLEVGLASVSLGAGRFQWDDEIDPKAGIVLSKKIGDDVTKGETVMTIFTDKAEVVDSVEERLLSALKISKVKPEEKKLIYTFMDKSSLS
ncbi:MAG: thymidine phosphorylase [Calditrichaeota bacterium]|nr:MAG: thymidine phosphorylase [Calditrichota bacterium]MBL1205359.1 thymidine phosphorylase [Calditrichota bacterium]NOG45188.1 thymidine phosphorylase [Calditrichota bacterium]